MDSMGEREFGRNDIEMAHGKSVSESGRGGGVFAFRSDWRSAVIQCSLVRCERSWNQQRIIVQPSFCPSFLGTRKQMKGRSWIRFMHKQISWKGLWVARRLILSQKCQLDRGGLVFSTLHHLHCSCDAESPVIWSVSKRWHHKIIVLIPFETSIHVVWHQQQHTELLQGDQLHVPLITLAHLKPFQQSFWIHLRHDALLFQLPIHSPEEILFFWMLPRWIQSSHLSSVVCTHTPTRADLNWQTCKVKLPLQTRKTRVSQLLWPLLSQFLGFKA